MRTASDTDNPMEACASVAWALIFQRGAEFGQFAGGRRMPCQPLQKLLRATGLHE